MHNDMNIVNIEHIYIKIMCKFLFFSGHSLIKNQLTDIQTMNTFYTITVFLAKISSLKFFILYLIDGYNLNKCISFTELFLILKKIAY